MRDWNATDRLLPGENDVSDESEVSDALRASHCCQSLSTPFLRDQHASHRHSWSVDVAFVCRNSRRIGPAVLPTFGVPGGAISSAMPSRCDAGSPPGNPVLSAAGVTEQFQATNTTSNIAGRRKPGAIQPSRRRFDRKQFTYAEPTVAPGFDSTGNVEC